MPIYMISYDLNEHDKKYASISNAIKNIGEWKKPMESCWFVKTEMKSDAIYSILKPFIDENDSIFVVRIKNDCDGRIESKIGEWLANELDN